MANRPHCEDTVSGHGLANWLDMVYTCTDLHDSKSIAAEIDVRKSVRRWYDQIDLITPNLADVILYL